MKKLLVGFLSLFLVAGTAMAQDVLDKVDQAEDLSKDANKALGAFNLNQKENRSKLAEAIQKIDEADALVGNMTQESLMSALNDEDDVEDAMKDLSTVYYRRGSIYGDATSQLVGMKQLGQVPDDLPQPDMPALKMADAYMKAFKFAQKKYQTKDAIKGLQSSQGSLNNMAILAFETKDYVNAYKNFNKGIVIHEMLKEAGESSTLDDEAAFNDQMYYAALAALNGKMAKDASTLFEKLYEVSYDNPLVYDGLYRINSADGDMEGAYKYLEAGRQKYPEDVGLLFTEINHFLQLNKLDELIGKLEAAIKAEPGNISLYSTLGNVYDNLYQREFEAGNTEKSQEYFDAALSYYNQALEKDPQYFDAIYSIGALYYNRAAIRTKELAELDGDYSKEGLAKYEAKKKEVFEAFEQALPYFKRCERLNPNDVNTLIALKEIYARKDDLNTSNEFKKRLEVVQAGKKNETSYFKE